MDRMWIRKESHMEDFKLNIPESAEPEEKLLILMNALNEIKDALDDISFEVETKSLDEAIDSIEEAVDSIGEIVDELENEEYELDGSMEDSFDE